MVNSLTPAVEGFMRLYSQAAWTSRGGYRLARMASRCYARARRKARFQLPSGIRMQLDIDEYPDCSMAFGLYELETVRALKRLLGPGDTFIDAGANIGYFSLAAAAIVGSSARVPAFEPFPLNAQRLRQNLSLNPGGANVDVRQVALCDRKGELPLYAYRSPEANHGQATTFPAPGASVTRWMVASARLDDELPDARPRLVKIDVEGCEVPLLRGMGRLLRQHRPAVIIELNSTTLAHSGHSFEEVAEVIAELMPDYTCRILRWPCRFTLPTAENLQNLPEVNLLFEPRPAGGRS